MIESYITYLEIKGFRKQTGKRIRRELGWFYEYVGGGLNNLPEKISKYYEYIRSKGYKESTIVLKMCQIMGYFKHLRRTGYILKDPTDYIKLPQRNRTCPYNIPGHKEIERIAERIDTRNGRKTGVRDRAIVELFYTSGIRRKELIGLDIYDVDLRSGQVFIREGKGGKDRVVPIGTETVKWLKEYINGKRKRHLKYTREKALFLSKTKRSRIKYSTIDSIFAKYKPVKNDGMRISAHRLRHACAIGMIRNGADIKYVQSLLGHEQLSTTQIYTKLSPEDLKAAYRKYHPRSRIKDLKIGL